MIALLHSSVSKNSKDKFNILCKIQFFNTHEVGKKIIKQNVVSVLNMKFMMQVYVIFQSPADRTLIYCTLYITECLKKLQKVSRV